MQTHKYKGKLFDVEYSSIKIGELEGDKRIDSDYYSVAFINIEKAISTKSPKPLGKYVQDGYRVVYENTKILSKDDENRYKNVGFLQATNISSIFLDKDIGRVNYDDWERYKKGRIKKGELLVEVKGNTEKLAIVPDDYPNNVLISGTLFKMQLKDIEPEYVLAFLLSRHGQLLKQKLQSNIAVSYINKDSLYSILIPSVSNTFQLKIKELIKNVEIQKKLSQKLYKESEDLLLRELGLLDYKTKTRKISLDGDYEMQVEENHSVTNYSVLKETDRLDAEYWDYKFIDIKDKFKGVKTDKLGNLVEYKKGIEVGTGKYIEESEVDLVDDKKYFVRVSNISKFGMTYNNSKYIKNEIFEELEDYQPQKGEILFSKDGTAGITYLLRENIDGIISGGIIRLQNISNLPSEYIELVLNSLLIQSEIERKTNGALIQHLKINDALDFDIPIIGEKEIESISDNIKRSFNAKNKSSKLLETAKRAVEIYIEEDEKSGFKFIENTL